MVKTRSGKSTEPLVETLCDIEEPVLFQAVLMRLASMMTWGEWNTIAHHLASLSPRSLIVALAAGVFNIKDLNAKRVQWMLRGPNPYAVKRPTMMREVRELDFYGIQTYPPSVHHFTSLRMLDWNCYDSLLPEDFFFLLRQHATGLQELNVWTQRITTPMLNDIVQMTNLESLCLSASFPDVIPPLGNLQGLKVWRIWDGEHYIPRDDLISPLTLEGLTRIEKLELYTKISDDLADMMPAMFPLLRKLRVDRRGLSQNAVATLESHYKDKEGFNLNIYG